MSYQVCDHVRSKLRSNLETPAVFAEVSRSDIKSKNKSERFGLSSSGSPGAVVMANLGRKREGKNVFLDQRRLIFAMMNVRSNCETMARLLRSSYEAVAKLLRSYCEAMTKLLRSYCEAIAKLLRSYCKATAKLLRSYLEASAKLLRSYCEATAKLLRSYCDVVS